MSFFLSCFKKLPSNVTHILALSKKVIPRLRLLFDVDVDLILSSENPFDFYVETYSLLPIF